MRGAPQVETGAGPVAVGRACARRGCVSRGTERVWLPERVGPPTSVYLCWTHRQEALALGGGGSPEEVTLNMTQRAREEIPTAIREFGPMTARALVRHLGMHKTAVYSALRHLEGAGTLQRQLGKGVAGGGRIPDSWTLAGEAPEPAPPPAVEPSVPAQASVAEGAAGAIADHPEEATTPTEEAPCTAEAAPAVAPGEDGGGQVAEGGLHPIWLAVDLENIHDPAAVIEAPTLEEAKKQARPLYPDEAEVSVYRARGEDFEVLQSTIQQLELELNKVRRRDLLVILGRQRTWSQEAFGPAAAVDRRAGILDHIRRKLDEVAAAPDDLSEWADIILLAFDGAWRAAATSCRSLDDVLRAITDKQAVNARREWPDWRTAPPDKAIEHVGPPVEDLAVVTAERDAAWREIDRLQAKVARLAASDRLLDEVREALGENVPRLELPARVASARATRDRLRKRVEYLEGWARAASEREAAKLSAPAASAHLIDTLASLSEDRLEHLFDAVSSIRDAREKAHAALT